MKEPVDHAHLIPNHGIEGDAHAGNWHRQISLLAVESVDRMRDMTETNLTAGVFAENILTKGIAVHLLSVGSRLQIGSSLCEVTQIGKECHNDCVIRRQVGDCVMPREGIFVKVLTEGDIKPGDAITVVYEK